MKKVVFKGEIDGKVIKEGSIVLINVPQKKLVKTNIDILKWYVSKKDYDTVYVTVNKPFSDLVERLKKSKIDLKKMFIIDAITPHPSTKRSGNAVFVGSPKELTNISITTTATIKKLQKAKLLLFDSVTTLLFYNDFKVIKDFIRFISSKMKALKITFAIICIKDMTDPKVILQLRSFVDEIIEIE